jgi:hypothetical protein
MLLEQRQKDGKMGKYNGGRKLSKNLQALK